MWPMGLLFVVLAIKERFVGKIFHLDQQQIDKLYDMKVDNFILDGKKYNIEKVQRGYESMDPKLDQHYKTELRKQVEEDRMTGEMVDELESYESMNPKLELLDQHYKTELRKQVEEDRTTRKSYESMDPKLDQHYKTELRKQVEEDRMTGEMVDELESYESMDPKLELRDQHYKTELRKQVEEDRTTRKSYESMDPKLELLDQHYKTELRKQVEEDRTTRKRKFEEKFEEETKTLHGKVVKLTESRIPLNVRGYESMDPKLDQHYKTELRKQVEEDRTTRKRKFEEKFEEETKTLHGKVAKLTESRIPLNVRDPLSDLTKDQRVVLYTLFLCVDDDFGVDLDDDVTMGDIDVRRTLSELEERGLVRRDGDTVYIYTDLGTAIDRRTEIVRSYMENCLLSDIDRDFYLQVASDYSLTSYIVDYPLMSTDTENAGDIPFTLMRLVMEGRSQDIALCNVEDPDEHTHVGFADVEFQTFMQEWCRLRNLDPMPWADEISYGEAVRFLSAYTILKTFQKEFTELVFDHKKWSILISILMSMNYATIVNASWEEKLETIGGKFPSMTGSNQYIRTSEAIELIKDLVYKDKLLTVNGDVGSGTVGFVSDDVRHQVMGHFVLNCLKTDEDYKNYFNMSSADSLFEYVRNWWYAPGKKERCMYLPERMEELFIRRLGIDAIRHVMVEGDYGDVTRDSVSEILKVPREILDWDYAARSRYAKCVKKGTQTIHRARAMIVGCAGAGKSTLLKRLQKRSLDELNKIQSTIGLEVHEDIFEITTESDCLKDVPVEIDKEGKQLLSILDFGGQCAYYACHQVYLSRRAFYLLVINMSKAFDEKVDPSICEQEGTMFTDWSYGEYMVFWLKSVHTYCDDDAPVIIVGSHLDQTKGQDSNTLYNSILDYLHFDKHLTTHIDRKRCFVLGFRSDGSFLQDTLCELEKCIVSIAKEDKWKESIPTDWALSEVVFRELREQKMRMTSVEKCKESCFGENEEKYTQMKDILKFYHDIGVLLHFDESSLAETVIIDIQWFVDSFKNIITDPNHVRDIVDNNCDWVSFYKSGHILDRLLTTIWNSRNFEISHWDRNQNKANLLHYMQRLGLIAVGTYAHYIPCMNKRTFGIKEANLFQSIQKKTSVLVFRFQFLPYFFYFRLIVACLTKTNGEWIVVEDNGLCLYKNVACFVYKRHAVALAVNRYSIQLQVFQPSQVLFAKDVTLEVRDNIERLLNGLTRNFHKKVMYNVGYQCSKQEVFQEHDDCFIEEKEIYGKGTLACPKHGMTNHHDLSESALLGYWKQDVPTEVTDLDDPMGVDECTSLPDLDDPMGVDECTSLPEIKEFNFKNFDKLTKIGGDALQIYFDRIFPPMDLASVLIHNKEALQHGQYKFNSDQCSILFPVDGSIPTSADFDVTIMYKLLRNYGQNLRPPTKGWGEKPDIGQRLPTDDVERIRHYRNEVNHKTLPTSIMEKDDFELNWKDLSQAILRLSNGSLKKDIMALRQQR